MRITWFSWKDIKHPAAGGAETISWEIMKRLVSDKHEVRLITARYKGSDKHEVIDGVEIFRAGNRLTVYPRAMLTYLKKFASQTDLVIEEMNTLPFGVGFYSRKKRVLLAYQLARQVWFYQAAFPVSYIGYALEPVYLFIMSLRYKTVLTESESSRQDFARYGLKAKNTSVFRVGIDIEPIQSLDEKKNPNSVLVLGSIRPMKRTIDAVKAFENARDRNPKLSLKLAGSNAGKYGEKVLDYASRSRHAAAIKVLGKVSENQRLSLMQEAGVIVVTSIKEGWGLIVTEANSQGTPAIAYDVDGLRDSVKDRTTGFLVASGDSLGISRAINDLVSDSEKYEKIRQNAWQDSKQYNYDNCYQDFTAGAGIITER